MRAGRTVLVAAIAVWIVCGTGTVRADEPPTWDAQVLKALQTPPDHPRRAMLVFPLVEAGSQDGTIGWGRGLIAMQAMWRSSFAPDRLLDTWDFWVHELYYDQQLVGPGRTVTQQKIENVCASFECPNYVTGVLRVREQDYAAVLVFHGVNGKRTETFTGPRDQIHLLPGRIARAVVDYLGVEVTPAQAAALAEPCLPSTEVFDQAAEHYCEWLPPHTSIVSRTLWERLAQETSSQWAIDAQLLAAASRGSDYAATWVNQLRDRADRTTALYAQAALDWRRAAGMQQDQVRFDKAAHSALELVRADPYNPYGLRWLVRSLGDSGHTDVAEAAIGRFDQVFGKGVMAACHRGLMMVGYAWDGRGSRWAYMVRPEQWAMFGNRLPRARADLEWVVQRDPRVWMASEELITMAMGMGLGDSYAQKRFAQAIAACPTDLSAYSRLMTFYAPKWGGSPGQVLDVGRRAAATGLYRSGIPFLLYSAYVNPTEGLGYGQRSRIVRDMLLSADVRHELEAVMTGSERAGVFSPADNTLRLVYAYWDGDRDAAQKVLDRMANPFEKGRYIYSSGRLAFLNFQAIKDWVEHPLPPLLEAARIQRLDEIDKLLQGGADVNQKGEDGRTALHVAATYSNLDVMDRLIEAGAYVNARADHGVTPLITACIEWEAGAVYRLLDAEADPNLVDDQGFTALHYAAAREVPDVVTQLLECGARPNVLNNDGDSPLLLAVRYDSDERNAQILLSYKADPNIRNAKGQTPLQFAAAYQRLIDMRVLLENGADVNAEDDDRVTPLHWAARNGQAQAVSALLEHGASLSARDRWKRTPADAGSGEELCIGRQAAAGPRRGGGRQERRQVDAPPLRLAARLHGGGPGAA